MKRISDMALSILRRLSIQQKIALSFLLTFLLLFGGQMLMFSWFLADIVSYRANDYMLETLRQTSGKVDACVDTVNILSKNIAANTEIHDVIVRNLSREDNGDIPYEDTEIIISELSKLTLAYDGINSVQLHTERFDVNYNFASDIESEDMAPSKAEEHRLGSSRGELVLLAARREYVDKITNRTIYVFSAARKVYDFRTGRELGNVFVNINEALLNEIIAPVRIGLSGNIKIFSRDGIIVSSEQSEYIGTTIDAPLIERINRGEREGFYITPDNEIVVYTISEHTGWGTVTRLPVSEVTSEYDELKNVNFTIGFLSLLVAALASVTVSGALTRPLKELLTTMRRIQDGDLSAKVHTKSQDEIGLLGQTFNQMTSEMHSLIEQYYRVELSKKESELKAMQMQISPHFLYNSLDSIYWMMVVRDEHEIADILVALCEVLRYSISRESGMVSLRRELEMIEHYMMIQKARFGSKLVFSVEIDESLKMLSVPKMIIQPLVENAIVHGMDAQKPALEITVSAGKNENRLEINVTDNGLGMNASQLDYVLGADAYKTPGHTGLGLETVHQRLQILFGSEYGLALAGKPGQGVNAKLVMPIVTTSK